MYIYTYIYIYYNIKYSFSVIIINKDYNVEEMKGQ
jgi:hypothetical protein